jgi:peptidoglycan-N-acetylglucosamine deacetylase
MKLAPIVLLALLQINPVGAAGPEAIGRIDRSLWPDPIDSPATYDRASRAEILAFSAALAEVSEFDELQLKTELRIKSADVAAVKRVRDRLTRVLFENYKAASKTCVTDDPFCPPVASSAALFGSALAVDSAVPAKFRPWLENARLFHRRYAGELIRLAALFPKVSSEIDVFNSWERQGFELADGHFLLTFDDGPSSKAGNTDLLIGTLSQHSVHAMFYVLGERLEARKQAQGPAALQTLYDGQCVSLHGWQHQSHEKWSAWQTSILDTQRLAKETFPTAYRPYFRPPYGQRRNDSGPFFSANGLRVGLWNIDSQDWNNKVTGNDAGQRVLTLMLLWRRGVVLFHDIHSKAQVAVPWLLNQTRSAGVTWDDCRQY